MRSDGSRSRKIVAQCLRRRVRKSKELLPGRTKWVTEQQSGKYIEGIVRNNLAFLLVTIFCLNLLRRSVRAI
jgi:hypothetical protein